MLNKHDNSFKFQIENREGKLIDLSQYITEHDLSIKSIEITSFGDMESRYLGDPYRQISLSSNSNIFYHLLSDLLTSGTQPKLIYIDKDVSIVGYGHISYLSRYLDFGETITETIIAVIKEGE